MHRRSVRERAADAVILMGMWIVIAMTLYPFLYVFSMSVSEPIHVIRNTVWMYPKGFSIQAYERIFENPDLLLAYSNTLFYAAAGTTINVAMTICGAYPLSRRSFGARNGIMIFIVITMFFSGGIIPNFILVNELGMYNTRWAVLLPVAVSAFLIIIARTFLQTIPEALHESATIDGANDLSILVRIILPLSMPILAVLTLFYAVFHWNSYFLSLLYLPNADLQPLQIFLMKIVINDSRALIEGMEGEFERSLSAAQLKYAIIIVAVLPILFVYPFLQKYFVKGVMIGSLKG